MLSSRMYRSYRLIHIDYMGGTTSAKMEPTQLGVFFNLEDVLQFHPQGRRASNHRSNVPNFTPALLRWSTMPETMCHAG